jgi:hypothetical protein
MAHTYHDGDHVLFAHASDLSAPECVYTGTAVSCYANKPDRQSAAVATGDTGKGQAGNPRNSHRKSETNQSRTKKTNHSG